MAENILDLRVRFMRQAQTAHRLPANLRQLGARGTAVAPAAALSPPVVVKIDTASPTTTRSHLRYMERQAGLNGADAQLFSRTGQAPDKAAYVARAQGDPHQFRMVVSLGRDVPDITAFIRRLMSQIERDVRTPLDWVAATHYNTAHTHTHITIRGRDVHDKAVYFRPDYYRHGLRARATHLLVATLGLTLVREQSRQLLQKVRLRQRAQQRANIWER